MPAPGGEAAPQGDNPITQALTGANEMLTNMVAAIEGSPGLFPEEAVEHLKNSATEYQTFMGMAMGQAGPEGAMGNTPADVQGKRGAVPADMPMGKGIKPVPA